MRAQQPSVAGVNNIKLLQKDEQASLYIRNHFIFPKLLTPYIIKEKDTRLLEEMYNLYRTNEVSLHRFRLTNKKKGRKKEDTNIGNLRAIQKKEKKKSISERGREKISKIYRDWRNNVRQKAQTKKSWSKLTQQTRFYDDDERYFDPELLRFIHELKKLQAWSDLQVVLYEYINAFDYKNFANYSDIQLIWLYARVCEYLELYDYAKEAYRMIIKHHRGDIQIALNHYDTLIKFDKPLYADLDHYYELLNTKQAMGTITPPTDIVLNMGEMVNSEYNDYSPTVSGLEDNFLLFSSERYKDTSTFGKDVGMIKKNEDIYISERDEDGIWGQSRPIDSARINTAYHEGSPYISDDRNILLFSRCGDPYSVGGCDIYVSFKLPDQMWSIPINLQDMNSPFWDSHPSLSVDNKLLFFSSNRPGGFGQEDLYVAMRTEEDGLWYDPINLGPFVNTKKKEVSPRYQSTNGVLYFSSSGHINNMGGFDIFKSHSLNGLWTEPINVGPLINTPENELYFSVDERSDWIFYSKQNPKRSDLDLHAFPLPMEARPDNLVRLSGNVISTVDEEFSGIVYVFDMDKGTMIAPKKIYRDGAFEFFLVGKRKYLILIQGDNFFSDGGANLLGWKQRNGADGTRYFKHHII